MPTIKNVSIDLAHTLDSGQLFRYFEQDGWWYVLNADKAFRMRSVGKDLEYEGNVDEKFIRHFMSVDDDISYLREKYPQDKALLRALDLFPGIKLTKQDPWECIISFLCSSNANIPKIKKNINGMAEQLGDSIVLNNTEYKTFPPLGSLHDEQLLRDVKTGYRAKFITGTNTILTQQRIDEIMAAPYTEAKKMLMELPGIGDKVSDCILLFGFQKYEAFPTDTWIYKIMIQEYPKCKNMNPKQVAEFARKRFGEDAGYVQQYLFYLSRKEY